MVSLNFNLNYSVHFPPFPKPYSRAKQRHQRKTRNHDTQNDTRICIDDLNDTLLELIFICFHWRQLALCKCVSKRWNSIISNPDFLRLLPIELSPFTIYLRGYRYKSYSFDKFPNGTCLVTEHPYFQRHKLRLGFVPGSDKYIDIVANHKDLLVTYRTLNQKSAYYIANPLTKRFIVVPLPSGIHYKDYAHWIPCKAVGFAGVVQGVSTMFGVANSNDYNNNGFRIVRIVENNNEEMMQIYSSKTGEWTSYPLNNTGFNFRFLNKKAVTTNNNIVCFEGASQILVIDPFDDDIIVTPSVLNFPGEFNSRHVLGFSRNRLHIAQLEKQSNVSEDYPRIKVWEFADLTVSYGITKMAELRLVIDFSMKPDLFERIMPPIFQIFPTIKEWRCSDRVICCHPYDPYIVYFIYRDTFYRFDVVKQRLKRVTYCVDDWPETYVFLHPLMTPK